MGFGQDETALIQEKKFDDLESLSMNFFFFQAEDGIRDGTVTGVQTCALPISGAPLTGVGVPPTQGTRVQSFSTEVAAGATTSLTWTAPRPGTYLLESGTHPSIQGPMGLYGMVVVTTAPGATAGTAYPAVGSIPAVTYNAEANLLFSEIDSVQNAAVNGAVNSPGFKEMTMRTFGGQVGSISVTNGGSGYTSNPAVTISGGGSSSSATATATVGAVITGITVTGGGSGYSTAPAVTINDTGTPITNASAVAVVSFAVSSVGVTSAGTGYLAGDVINLTGGGGSGAAASVATVDASGGIVTVTVTNGGSGYTSAPTVSSITSVAGTGAVLAPAL